MFMVVLSHFYVTSGLWLWCIGCRLYGEESGINFSSWFIFAGPNMVISLLLAWLWLMLCFIGPRSDKFQLVKTFTYP